MGRAKGSFDRRILRARRPDVISGLMAADTGSRKLAVLLISEDELARSVLAERIAEDESLLLVGSAASADEARAIPVNEPPELILFDAGPRPDASAIDSIEMPVLALTPDSASAQDFLAAGALGVVLRDSRAPVLAAAAHAVADGLVVAQPELVRGRFTSRSVASSEDLTPREREVLSLLVEGLSNRLIAERLGISDHTAKFHVNAVLQKLGAQTRTEAVVRAARLGLVTL